MVLAAHLTGCLVKGMHSYLRLSEQPNAVLRGLIYLLFPHHDRQRRILYHRLYRKFHIRVGSRSGIAGFFEPFVFSLEDESEREDLFVLAIHKIFPTRI
jgi:hypothetical protein